MEAFFAVGAACAALRHLEGRNALCSFAYLRKFWTLEDAARLREKCKLMFLDSGAFTAWKSGRPIDLGAYVAFVEEHASEWDYFAVLDDIEDWRKSIANWRTMLARLPHLSDRLVPVYHEGEPLDVLDEYVAGAAYAGVGRTDSRRSTPKTHALYNAVFDRHPAARLHAFGCGDPKALEPYPWASFDSTTWERNSTYSKKHGFPLGYVEKDDVMALYVKATCAITHKPAAKPSTRQKEMFR